MIYNEKYATGRVIMYPSSLLHGAHIDREAAGILTCDPERGRLVISSFWAFE